MKTTDKQIAANRKNAAQSTGPVTPAGKATAARNSLKHGLLAREVVIDAGEGAESQEEFDALLLDLKGHFDPQGPLEEIMVEKAAVAYWRLRRAYRYEAGLIRQKLDNVSDRYYSRGLYQGPPGHTPHRRDEEIDAQIRAAQKDCLFWQSARDQFTQLRQDGRDLREIYGLPCCWNWLYAKLVKDGVKVSNATPVEMRESLRKAGLTDDAIWQAHLEVCAARLQAQTRKIEDWRKEKQDHALALQVRSKVGSIPDESDLDRLLKYEGSLEKQFSRAIDQLERLQRLRAGEHVPAPVNIDVAVHTENTN